MFFFVRWKIKLIIFKIIQWYEIVLKDISTKKCYRYVCFYIYIVVNKIYFWQKSSLKIKHNNKLYMH